MTFGVNELRMPETGKTYRVVQWASGRTGSTSGRALIKHPHMELVGLWVHSADKEGRDAGEIFGVEPVGIKATRSIDEVIALQPDAVLYMQAHCDLDQVCALLEAGINIVTTMGEFHYPPRMDPAVRKRVEDACRKGGSSVHSSGVSPGFISESFPLMLASVSRRINSITIDEFANLPPAVPADMLLEQMGFGRSGDAGIDPKRLQHTANHFSHSLGVAADALGLAFDDVVTKGEVALAREPVQLPGGRVIEKGTVASQRITVSGMVNGRALLNIRLVWYCSADTEPKWQVQESGWRVVMEGDTPFDIAITLPETPEPRPSRMAGYSVYRAINEIPYVCAAAPGICTSADLPQIIPTGLA